MELSNLIRQITDVFSQVPVVGYLFLGIVGLGRFADWVLNAKAKLIVSDYILSVNERKNTNRLLEVYIAFIDQVFNFRVRKKLILPSIVRSVICSSLVFLAVITFSPAEVFESAKNTPIFFISLIIAFNFLIDYVSLSETRYVIKIARRQNHVLSHVALFLVDLLLSLILVLVVYFFIELLSGFRLSFETSTGQSPWFGGIWILMDETNHLEVVKSDVVNPFYGAFVGIADLVILQKSDWGTGQYWRLLFLATSLTTSLWLWVFLVGTYIQRLLQTPIRIRKFISEYTIFNKIPFTVSSLLSGVLIVSVSWPLSTALSELFERKPFNEGMYVGNGMTVYIDDGNASITEQSQLRLTQLAEMLTLRQHCVLQLEGHIDPKYSRDYALALGDRYPQAVASFIGNLLPENSDIQFNILSYGAERPPEYDNFPFANLRRSHQRFRRVEIIADCI